MSLQSRIDRERYGPSLVEVTLGALFSLLLGAALAAGYLIFRPVKTVRELPKEGELKPGEVVFVEGTKSTARAAQWMRKRQLLVEGQSAEISLVEDELNAWIAEGAKPAPGAEAPAPAWLQPTAVNFRVREGVMQIGAPSSLNAFGYTHPVVFQVRGTFEKVDDRFEFVPSESYLGWLALHRIPALESMLTKNLLRTQSAVGDVAAAWDRVANASIDGNTLNLTLR